MSQNILLAKAAEVDERWPLTHGAFCNVLALHDPHDFFTTLRNVVLSQPQECFTKAIRGCIIYELYEMMGKLRNAHYSNNTSYFPAIALHMTTFGAYIIGLASRYHYTFSSQVLNSELLTLPEHPFGYDELCHLVMSGDLRNPQHIYALCETFWAGVEQWAAEHRIDFEANTQDSFLNAVACAKIGKSMKGISIDSILRKGNRDDPKNGNFVRSHYFAGN